MNDTSWLQKIGEPIGKAVDLVGAFLPNLVGAVLLVAGGWLVARVLRTLVRRAAEFGMAHMRGVAFLRDSVDNRASLQSLPRLLGSFVFWIVFLLALAAALEALGLHAVSTVLSGISTYLPRVLMAAIILLAGVLLGEACGNWARAAAIRSGIAYAALLGRSVQIILITVAALMAIDQLGVESKMLITIVGITAGISLAAAALAFGLGARELVGNILATNYVRQMYRTGDAVRMGDCEGNVLEITSTHVVIETDQGRVHIPGRQFISEKSTLIL